MELLHDVFVQPAAFHAVKLRLHGFVKLNLKVVRWSDHLGTWQHYTARPQVVKGQERSRIYPALLAVTPLCKSSEVVDHMPDLLFA
jgi:hypothetical protein